MIDAINTKNYTINYNKNTHFSKYSNYVIMHDDFTIKSVAEYM